MGSSSGGGRFRGDAGLPQSGGTVGTGPIPIRMQAAPVAGPALPVPHPELQQQVADPRRQMLAMMLAQAQTPQMGYNAPHNRWGGGQRGGGW